MGFEACRRARGKGQLVLVGAKSDVRHYRPLPGCPFSPSLPFCLSVARALFSSLGSRGFRGLPAGKRKKTASFLSVQIATLGTTGCCPEARSVLHCHAA